jgi:hypothetical protein
MEKKDLLALEKMASLKPADLEKQQPELFNTMLAKAGMTLKSKLEEQVKDAPEEIKKSISQIDFSNLKLSKTDIRKTLAEKVLKENLTEFRKKEIEEAIVKIPALGTVNDILLPELPVFMNPLFQKELQQAKMYRLNNIVGIEEKKVEKLFAAKLNLNSIDEEQLNNLVNDKTLSAEEALRLGVAANMHQLVDGNFELTEIIYQQKEFTRLSDLVKVDTSTWIEWIKKSNIALSDDISVDEYAGFISKKVENLFPEEALQRKFSRIAEIPVQKNIEILQVLRKENEKLFGDISFDGFKLPDLPEKEIKVVREAYEQLDKLVKLNPGLNLGHILDNEKSDFSGINKNILDRLELINKFRLQNQEVNYLNLEYKHDSEDLNLLNFSGFSETEKTMVLKNIKAQQRIFSFTQDVDLTEKIMTAGYHSSYHIASVTEEKFVKDTRLDVVVGSKLFREAHLAVIRAGGIMGTIIDVISGGFDNLAVGNIGTDVSNYFRDIPGYQDLFGKMDFCDCSHCQSIYSPAAYFVDLMQFVEKNITSKNFTGSKSSHVLNLKNRRTDLWTLELSCENTSDPVPYLDIINEILENFIAQRKSFSGSFSNRPLVESFVYKRIVSMEGVSTWKNEIYSFQQPFHLPLNTVATYLRHFEYTREGIAALLQKSQAVISKNRFNLSDREYELVVKSELSPAFLQRLYGLPFAVSGSVITPFNVQDILKPLNVDRKDLQRLITTRFINEGGFITIRSEKKNSDSLQNDVERIHNLSYVSLDRLHRFVRLLRKTGFTIEEFDLLLSVLSDKGINDINETSVTLMGKWLAIGDKFEFSLEELVAMIHEIPQQSLKPKESSLFERMFNHKDIVFYEGTYPKNTIRFIHPDFIIDQTSPNAEFSSSRLTAAFNITDAELKSLITPLAQWLGAEVDSPNEDRRGFLLTLNNLSVLYRHYLLAYKLKMPINDFFRFIKLISDIPNGYIQNEDHLSALLEWHNWWKKTSYSLDDLHIMLKKEVADRSKYPSVDEISEEIVQKITQQNQTLFSDTVFSYIDGITELESRMIIASNDIIIKPAEDGTLYRLTPAFDPSVAINIPSGITVAEPLIRSVLYAFHSRTLIPAHLSSVFNFSENWLLKALESAGFDFNNRALLLEIQDRGTAMVELPKLVEALIPLSVLLKSGVFNEASATYFIDHLSLFEISDLNQLTLKDVKTLHTYASFLIMGEKLNSSVTDLNDVLDNFIAHNAFQLADKKKIARILNSSVEAVSGIYTVTTSFTNPLKALAFYKEIAACCQYIGVNVVVLEKIAATDYDQLNQAGLDLLGAFRSKYRDEQERNEKIEKYHDIIRGKKRAALTTLLIHSGYPQFEDTNDLYNYFLVDTELEGCARTSRLVAATMSLQLYIHRVLMNLEQDAKEPGTADRVHVQLDDRSREEWEWRKNYRVWEANRKVFLYPENYIEPDLRDDKTPLFEELEKELLQQEINADTVMDAYAKYMRGFDELAHLKIAGTYHEKDDVNKTDVLHLIGVTSDDPCVYYYRKVENIYYSEKVADRGVIWKPWEKIDVQIPVRKVAPVVFNGRLYLFWVHVTTIANSAFEANKTVLTGYSHRMSIDFTSLKLDGSWSSPQKLDLRGVRPFEGNGVIKDPLIDKHEQEEFGGSVLELLTNFPFFNFNLDTLTEVMKKMKTPRYAADPHYETIEDYTLSGFLWDQVFPTINNGEVFLSGAGFQLLAPIDFYDLKLRPVSVFNTAYYNHPTVKIATKVTLSKPGKIIKREGTDLFRAVSPSLQLFDNFSYGTLLLNAQKNNFLLQRYWSESLLETSFDNIKQNKLLSMPIDTSVQLVNGSYSDYIVSVQQEMLYLQGSPVNGNGFFLKRLGTTLSEKLTRILFTSGVETTLSIQVQNQMKETLPYTSGHSAQIFSKVVSNRIDWSGAYGTYYREIFFHIPFLIANYLNSQGKYADAQKWYHYIFNPGSTEVINYPAAATPDEKKRLALDRNWQYLEFRKLGIESLRNQLNNGTAIEAYKRDPFNPHAIARLRLSAYQKTIVMKYIDNLLDWADHLFTQDTMESVNEATLLYVIAREILGDKPVQIGDCGEGTVSPKNYQTIQPLLSPTAEFLAELETYTVKATSSRNNIKGKNTILSGAMIKSAGQEAVNQKKFQSKEEYDALTNGYSIKEYKEIIVQKEKNGELSGTKAVDYYEPGAFTTGVSRGKEWKKESPLGKQDKAASFGWSFVHQVSPVFCIPGNKDLLDYYDRVDDRLFKLRNCMNILGQKRQLALFSPEIDPKVLVRAKAAGLSLEDLLNSSAGNLPPYRFTYLLEKAKAFTGMVQSFGSALLSAIEKKNVEELSLIRMTQQQNLLELSTKSRDLEIRAAEEAVKAAQSRIESLTYQLNYYQSLIVENRNAYEKIQSVSKHIAAQFHMSASVSNTLSAVLALIPQVGSPMAMKYGGAELHSSIENFAKASSSFAQIQDNISSVAAMEAGFQRRSDGWKHQKKLLEHELLQAEKALSGAEIRRDVLNESRSLHLKSIEHNQEVLDFFGEKFTNIGLYTWLSSTMQQIYKEALNNALAIARMAEQAYKYERDHTGFFIEGSYFDSSKAGLLSGEKLMMALQAMERKYIETNHRKNEIDQTFSLTQISPSALLSLKQTGTCEFEIPEIFLDLFYPGQYRRRIQSVRLTIPSVTGPYTNISATLSLMSSQIRMEAKLGQTELKEVPKSRTTVIATSTAQNDAGVFQVNFKDERYMPFEGAGVISKWKLSLPKNFRQFDYQTVNDVIVHISYTAEYDELFRDKVEEQSAVIEGTLTNVLSEYPLARTLSLRQEFSTDFHRLTEQPVNTPVTFKIQDKHFPFFLNGKTLSITKAKLVLITAPGQTVSNVSIRLNDVDQSGFDTDSQLGNLYTKDLGTLFNTGIIKNHTIEITNAGDLAAAAPVMGPATAIDTNKLYDVVVYLEYGL